MGLTLEREQIFYYDEKWIEIENLLMKFMTTDKRKRSEILNLYSSFNKYFLQNDDKLYQRFREFTKKCAQAFHEKIRNSPDPTSAYIDLWTQYKTKAGILSDFLSRVENYVEADAENDFSPLTKYLRSDTRPLTAKGLFRSNWQLEVVEKMIFELAQSIFEDFQRERDDQVTLYQSKVIIDSLIECQEYNANKFEMYTNYIKHPYVERLKGYYKSVSEAYLAENAWIELVNKSVDFISKETSIELKYMPLPSGMIAETVWRVLVMDNIEGIISFAVGRIKESDVENLSKANDLLGRSPDAMKRVYEAYREYEEGVFGRLREGCDDGNFCDEFLRKFHEEKTLAKDILKLDSGYLASLDKAVVKTLNRPIRREGTKDGKSAQRVSTIPDILSCYCDELMKRRKTEADEKESNLDIEKVMTIFKYVEDKDIFHRLYSKCMARRLIFSTSQSVDAEESMVNSFKVTCGHEYVRSLERMISDVKNSKEISGKFGHGNSFGILIIQPRAWPVQADKTSFLIPQQLEKRMQTFKDFYAANHKGRKLTWCHAYGTCVVTMNCSKRPYTMETSTLITSILIAFNKLETATLADISSSTGIETGELMKNLKFLTNKKILLHQGSTDTFEDSSTFTLNRTFECKRPKFKLMPVSRESAEAREGAVGGAVEERKFILQTLIVRIMKAQKRMTHRSLVQEVLSRCSMDFVPSHVLIKQTIDLLVSKEYIGSVEGKADEYYYIA